MIVDGPGDAAWNMAVDAALLELASTPTLRLYGWSPHAVSLGWFQRFDDFADLPPDAVVVRRQTGGGAIHHGDELTFSLALDAALLPGVVAQSYVLLHDAVVRALAAVGVTCRRAGTGHPAAARPGNRWCFAEPTPEDLVTARGKLLGSAQRRLRGERPRVLHHGSLVLERPALTPFVAAVADQQPVTAALRAQLADAIVTELAEVLGLAHVVGSLDADERALASTLQREVFASADHLRRR